MAAGQQGSRAALITTLVIFVILFFVASFYAWQNIAEVKRSEDALNELKKSVKRVIPEGDLASVRSPAPGDNRFSQDRPYYYVQQDMIRELRTALAAQPTSRPADAVAAALGNIKTRLNQAGLLTKYNISFENKEVLNALDPLAKAIMDLDQKINQLQGEKNVLEQQKKAAEDAIEPARQTFKQELDQTKAALAKAQTDKADLEKAYKDMVEAEKAAFAKDLEAAKNANLALDDQRKKAESDAAKALQDKEGLLRKLAVYRPQNLDESSIRRAGGEIVQVSKDGVVYINRGVGDRIYMGMTFEIYDRKEGIPRMANEDQLPVGKGSLEVIRVGQGSSECRIIKMQPDQQPMVGDIIANLVYDPNVKWTFMVYGDFDIDGDGRATAAEFDTIKRLITTLGIVTDKLNVDTDFLVMGQEPRLPQYTKDDIEKSPMIAYEMKKAEEALKKYDDIKRKALELHIPILNQNRFLYLVGYFDQARK